MPPIVAALLTLLAAYLAGSIPFGLLTARLAAGIDIRREGSGNIGATNVARVLGAKWGVVVLVFDAIKGLLPVWLLPQLFAAFTSSTADAWLPHLQVGCGVATILGHMFPCWLGFRGGKGVATALGVVLVLAPMASATAFVVFLVVFFASRMVSLGSVLAAIAFAVAEFWLLAPAAFSAQHWSRAAFSLLVPLLILVRHRGNLVRIVRGEEPRFRFGGRSGRATASSTSTPSGDCSHSLPEGGRGSES